MCIPLYSRLRTPVNEQVDNEFGSFCGCHDTEMTDLLISKCNFAAQSASVVVKTLLGLETKTETLTESTRVHSSLETMVSRSQHCKVQTANR